MRGRSADRLLGRQSLWPREIRRPYRRRAVQAGLRSPGESAQVPLIDISRLVIETGGPRCPYSHGAGGARFPFVPQRPPESSGIRNRTSAKLVRLLLCSSRLRRPAKALAATSSDGSCLSMRLRFRGPVARKGLLVPPGRLSGSGLTPAPTTPTLRPGRDTSDPRGRPRRRVARGKALLDSLVDSGFPGIVTRVTALPPGLYSRPAIAQRLDRFDASGVTSSPGPAIPRASRPMPTSAVTTPAGPPRRRPHAPSAAPAITDRMRGTAATIRAEAPGSLARDECAVARLQGVRHGHPSPAEPGWDGLNGAILGCCRRHRRPGAQLASIDQPFQHDAIIRVALRLDDKGELSRLDTHADREGGGCRSPCRERADGRRDNAGRADGRPAARGHPAASG